MPVYVIGATKNGPIKIGKSDSSSGRLRAIQTANHQRLHLFCELVAEEDWSERFNVVPDHYFEKILHSLFQDKRLAGEWFDLSVESFMDDVGCFCRKDMGNNTKSWDRYCRHNNIPEKEVILASFIWNHDYDVSEDELN